jgi:gliding motility-associated-like protein
MLQRILIIISFVFPFQLMAQDFQIITTDASPCVGETITLNHENNLNSNWTISAPNAFDNNTGTLNNVAEIELSCLQAGEYTISATEGTNQESITITVYDVSATFTHTPYLIERNKITFASVEQPEPYDYPYTFTWDFGDGNTNTETKTASDENPNRSIVTHTYDLSNGDSINTISLTVTSNQGCSDTYQVKDTIHSAIFIPNVFTPNNDGQNDNFVIPSPDGTLLSITIFSRWGNIVYESDQPTTVINWDGRLRDNSYVSSGVYYYVLEPKDNPQMEKKMGFVHVYTNQNK